MSTHQVNKRGASERRVPTPDREPQTDGLAASTATAPEHEGHAMNTTLSTDLSTDLPSPGPSRPAPESTNPVETLRALSTLSERELVDLAERHDIGGDRCGLDAARDEAERRAQHEAPESLAAQVAGYVGLLAEDTEHALADEAHAWGLELHRILDADASVPAPRAHADRAVRS